MPRDKGELAHLHDMRAATEAVLRYLAAKTRDDYDRDDLLQAAVERRLEIIGEAARCVSQAFQDAHPQIAWRKIMATRHIIAHDYDEVNHDIVWQIVTVHLPILLEQLRPLIPAPPPDPEPEP
jgi:uncharacterized protein with HEPN domain